MSSNININTSDGAEFNLVWMVCNAREAVVLFLRQPRKFMRLVFTRPKLFFFGHRKPQQTAVTLSVLTKRAFIFGTPLELSIKFKQPVKSWRVRLMNAGVECLLIPQDRYPEGIRLPWSSTSQGEPQTHPVDSIEAPVQANADSEILLISPTPFRIGVNHPKLEIITENQIQQNGEQLPSPTIEIFRLGKFVCSATPSAILDRSETPRFLSKWCATLKAIVETPFRNISKRNRIREICKSGFYVLQCPERLGHLLMDTLVCVAENRQMQSRRRKNAFWILPRCTYALNFGWVSVKDKIANKYLLELLKRHIPIIDDIYPEDIYSQKKLFAKRRYFPMRLHQHRDIHCCLQNSPLILQFSPDEDAAAAKQMQLMGMLPNSRFVIVHLREHRYEATIYGEHYSTSRYSYRNPDLHSYHKAVQWLASQGYYVILMGAKVEGADTIHARVIDYAGKYRSEFMDVWLGAHCSFFVGTTSGSWSLAAAFKRPILYTNFFPYPSVHAWEANSMVLFQKVVEEIPTGSRVLKIKDVLSTPELGAIHLDLHPDFWATRSLVPNTETEILDAVEEMARRYEGTWIESTEDKRVQKQFWNHFQPNSLNFVFRIRVGSKFLHESGLL